MRVIAVNKPAALAFDTPTVHNGGVMSEKNQLYFGDNLDVLRRYVADESVDLVYHEIQDLPSFHRRPHVY